MDFLGGGCLGFPIWIWFAVECGICFQSKMDFLDGHPGAVQTPKKKKEFLDEKLVKILGGCSCGFLVIRSKCKLLNPFSDCWWGVWSNIYFCKDCLPKARRRIHLPSLHLGTASLGRTRVDHGFPSWLSLPRKLSIARSARFKCQTSGLWRLWTCSAGHFAVAS